MEKSYLQITSGRGPAECCRIVSLLVEKILKEAKDIGLEIEVIDREKGVINRTLFSAIMCIKGKNCEIFTDKWNGTIQWISQSPYRKYHKRKNWFVGVNKLKINNETEINERDIVFQTLKASGPGGQHVNKTESAVRAIHTPTGISSTASDQRSQLQNKKLAAERLIIKLSAWKTEQDMINIRKNWNNHNCLVRGNPVKVFKEILIP